MKRLPTAIVAATLLLLLAATGATAETVDYDRSVAVQSGGTAEWDGEPALGLNQNYFNNFIVGPTLPVPRNLPDELPDEVEGPGEGALADVPNANPLYEQFPVGTCDQARVTTYCEHVLIEFSNPVPATDSDGRLSRTATVTLSGYGPVPGPGSDFDLVVYQSDAEGTLGAEIGHDGGLPEDENDLEMREVVSFPVATTAVRPDRPTQVDRPTVWVLARIVYFTSPNSTYHGTVAF